MRNRKEQTFGSATREKGIARSSGAPWRKGAKWILCFLFAAIALFACVKKQKPEVSSLASLAPSDSYYYLELREGRNFLEKIRLDKFIEAVSNISATRLASGAAKLEGSGPHGDMVEKQVEAGLAFAKQKYNAIFEDVELKDIFWGNIALWMSVKDPEEVYFTLVTELDKKKTQKTARVMERIMDQISPLIGRKYKIEDLQLSKNIKGKHISNIFGYAVDNDNSRLFLFIKSDIPTIGFSEMAVLEKGKPNLSQTKDFNQAYASHPSDKSLFSYLKKPEKLSRLHGRDFLKFVDFIRVQSQSATITKSGITSKEIVRLVEDPKLFGAPMEIPTVSSKKLQMAPRDVSFLFMSALPDFLPYYKGLITAFENEAGRNPTKEIHKINEQFGIDFEKDIVGSIGSHVFYYSLKSKGLLGLSPRLLAVDVKNRAKLDALIKKGLGALPLEKAATPLGNLSLEQAIVSGIPVTKLALPMDIASLFYGFDKDVLLFSLGDTAISMRGEAKSDVTRSILSNKDFKRLTKDMPKDITSLVYMDVHDQVDGTLSLMGKIAEGAGIIALLSGNAGYDFTFINEFRPAVKAIKEYKHIVSWGVPTKSGWESMTKVTFAKPGND